MSDAIIIAQCGCPTPQRNTCEGCGCCTDCCDGYACDDCGKKCLDLQDWHPWMLCDKCIDKRIEREQAKPKGVQS